MLGFAPPSSEAAPPPDEPEPEPDEPDDPDDEGAEDEGVPPGPGLPEVLKTPGAVGAPPALPRSAFPELPPPSHAALATPATASALTIPSVRRIIAVVLSGCSPFISRPRSRFPSSW